MSGVNTGERGKGEGWELVEGIEGKRGYGVGWGGGWRRREYSNILPGKWGGGDLKISSYSV